MLVYSVFIYDYMRIYGIYIVDFYDFMICSLFLYKKRESKRVNLIPLSNLIPTP